MTNREICDQAWQHLDAARLDDAQRLFADVLARDPNYSRALHGNGRVAQLAQRHDVAADHFVRALRGDPKNPEIHFHLALTQNALGRSDDALRSLRAAVALSPYTARYRAALGTLLEQRGQLSQAATELRRAVELAPDDGPAHVNLSSVLLKLDDVTGAQLHARRAVALDPSLSLAHANLGAALNAGGDFDGAVAAYRAAVAADPNDADAHFALGLSLLMTSQFTDGWIEHEWRFRTRYDPTPLPNLPGPQWTGDDPAGKIIFVHSEQGLGDTIHFARYLPLLAQRGANVFFRSQDVLAPLMRTLIDVNVVTDARLRYDAHIPLLSLPRLMATTLDSVPADVPYLHADTQKIDAWRSRLGALPPGKRVGLCWTGSAAHPRDRLRSLDPTVFSPLASIANIQWISLQKQKRTANPPLPLHDFTAELRDFSDTAALMMNLDLIVTVDTSIAHLAGALARPVWTMIPFFPDWRWLVNCTDSPWYPTMQLFRQPARHDWPSVITAIAAALRE